VGAGKASAAMGAPERGGMENWAGIQPLRAWCWSRDMVRSALREHFEKSLESASSGGPGRGRKGCAPGAAACSGMGRRAQRRRDLVLLRLISGGGFIACCRLPGRRD